MDFMQNDLRRSLGLPAIPIKGVGKKIIRSNFDAFAIEIRNELAELSRIRTLQRFKWHGLPQGLDGELMEQMIFTNGSIMVFYDKVTQKFYAQPYALTSESVKGSAIDEVRRFRELKPLPYGGSSALIDDKGKAIPGTKPSVHDVYLGQLIKTNIMSIPFVEDMKQAREVFENGAVLIFDRTPGRAYNVRGREHTVTAFMNQIETILSTLQAAAVNATGFGLYALADGNSAELIQMQLDAITEARLHGAVNAVIDAKGLNLPENIQTNHPADLQAFWANYYNTINQMSSCLGLDSSGAASGSQYTNQSQIAVDNLAAQAVYINAFNERVKSAVIINAIWGTKCYPEPVQLTGISLAPEMGAEQESGEPAVGAGEGEGFNETNN